MNIPDEIKEKIDKRAKGVGMLPIRMRVEDIEFGYGLASEEITMLQKIEKDLVEQQIILIKERREMEVEIEMLKKELEEMTRYKEMYHLIFDQKISDLNSGH